MKEWPDVKKNLVSLNSAEKEEINKTAGLVAEIIQRRLELSLTQRRLAELSGVKQSAIARLERNGAIPRIDTLFKLLKPLGLTITLINDTDNSRKP